MRLNKSYRLLRFLNREHGAVWRYGLALAGWVGAVLATRSVVLANGLFREFADDHFDIAFRKAARYARHVSHRLDVFNDPFFDFTTGTLPAERAALARLIASAGDRPPASARLTDLMYIKAADIHERLARGEQPWVDIADYYRLANQALESHPEPSVHRSHQPERSADFSREDGIQALRDIAALLPLAQWPWYVMSGTFLGLHRENGFLGHDYDIDLGINAEQVDVDALAAHLRRQTRFAIKKMDHHLEVTRDQQGRRHLNRRLSLIKLVHPNGLHLDIFIHYTEDSVCWHGSIIHRWENTPFNLVCRELEGVPVYAPDNADRYLSENYGDWRTPVTDFDCSTGTPNLVVSRNFLSLALFIKRFTYFREHDPEQAIRLRNTLEQSGVIARRGEGWRVVERV